MESDRYTHLNVLNYLLSNERLRLENAKTENEKIIRRVHVAGLEKEIQHEKEFLGLQETTETSTMNDDDLLNQLFN